MVSCLAIIAAVNLGCLGMKKPWRDYSRKPFPSQEWLAGDKIERGRMWLDLAKRDASRGKTRDAVIEKQRLSSVGIKKYRTEIVLFVLFGFRSS
ncbi:MAG: hypothetical protein H7070_02415 [Saprospiraceae bacterium]|nr:hypothetical protein [Pyrinomonadaceae bacterium]